MKEEFFSQRITGNSGLAGLGIDPSDHPFLTDAYAQAIQLLGQECWVLGVCADGEVRSAAIAAVRRGRMGATLEIASLPAAAAGTVFWDGVYDLAKKLKITDLVAGTFGSPGFAQPALRGEISRKERVEYAVALEAGEFESRLCSNHRKNIRRARAAGLTLRRCLHGAESAAEHARMIAYSRMRRAARGEAVTPGAAETEVHRAYLASGAGELFQAVHEGEVVSSLLVLRSARAAYCQSTGTSPEGMHLGASAFLFHGACRALHMEGVRTMNLGGAPAGSSLAEFKAGFGAEQFPLVECACYVGPMWLKKLRSGLRLARTDRAQFRKLLSGNSYRMCVFAHATHAPLARIAAPEGARFQALSESDLTRAAGGKEEFEFRQRQLERLRGFGAGRAYGVYVGDKLAHVSWLLPPETVALERPKFLALQADEAEITGSETLPGYRGRKLYPFAIQQIVQVAHDSGIRRVLMKTRKENLPSQAGILKAGLRLSGEMTVITPPAIPGKMLMLRRFGTAG